MAVTAIADEVSITGTGLWAPADVVSNAELVESLTVASTRFNEEHAAEIEAGSLAARPLPNEEFIVKASGIKSRHVVDKVGVLDPDRMRPHLEARTEDQLGVQAEMAMPAIEQALAQAGRDRCRRRRRDRRLLQPAAGLSGGGDRDPGRARRVGLGATT